VEEGAGPEAPSSMQPSLEPVTPWPYLGSWMTVNRLIPSPRRRGTQDRLPHPDLDRVVVPCDSDQYPSGP
jgi:hypothetical protein